MSQELEEFNAELKRIYAPTELTKLLYNEPGSVVWKLLQEKRNPNPCANAATVEVNTK